ncbi:MAG: NUDIX hydrolase [Pirellulales bacterium]|nr:NUDIX hydrolase [Pirellulales bacterium]
MAKTKPASWYEQSGVVPYRTIDVETEVLLITSVKKGNWIVPKGIVEPGYSPAESAIKEALEEGGVVGQVVGSSLGAYEQEKWGGVCRVHMFAMTVHEQLDHWPEAHVRQRQWLPIEEAAEAVAKAELGAMIRKLADRLGTSGEI